MLLQKLVTLTNPMEDTKHSTKNLIYKQFNIQRVMKWHPLIEKFSPELTYIKGEKNIVADALSRLEIDFSDSTPPDSLEQLLLSNMEYFATDIKLPSTVFPVSFQLIHQQ